MRSARVSVAGLDERIAHHARSTPVAPAVIFEQRTTSYGEIAERAERVAGGLDAAGVERGERVGLLLRNMPEFVEVLLACLRLGAILVPLNTRLTPVELSEIAADAGLSVLITELAFADAIAELEALVPDRRIFLVGTAPAPFLPYAELDGAVPPLDSSTALDEPLLIQYSSGTTGKPKGVVMTHGNVVAAALSVQDADALTQTDRAAVPVPLAFTGALMSVAIPFLYAGCSMLIEQQLDAEALLDHVEHDGVTFIGAVPVVWATMATSPTFPTRDISNLRIAKSGGAPVPESLLETFQARGVSMVGAYGLTEAAGINIQLPARDSVRKLGFAGLPLLGNECRITTEAGQVTAAGEIGELTLRGPMVTPGYWQDPKASAEALRDGWLHTGDLAFADEEGYIKIVDRKKDMLISGGMNVYPAELERVLTGHSGVGEVAIVGAPHDRWGEVAVAFIAPSRPDLDEEELRAFCRERLADYKRPERYVFTGPLPRNMSGKVLKRELREQLHARHVFRADTGGEP